MLTKKCIVLTAIIFIAMPAICQQILQGNIVDSSTNLPLEGATVTLLPSKISTVTNAAGNFIFKRNITSETSISVSEIGYADGNFSINEITKTASLKIAPRRIMLEDVTVVANAGEQY